MKLTKNQQEFIGTTFNVERTGATLTVTGVVGKNKSSIALFKVECSKCSSDRGLFPDGISSTKGNLVNGRIPCGCSNVPTWNAEQDEIHAQRILDEKMPHLKVVGSEKVKGKPREFILECETCSRDDELWPLGSITSLKGHLVSNQIPCGCAFNPKWSEDQFKIKVQRECKTRGYIFHGFAEKFKGAKTYLDLYNPSTNNRWQSTRIHNFLNTGHGDPEEWKQKLKESGVCYGYYPHRKMEQDNLYIIRFKMDETIKVGRAFDVGKRIHDSKGLLKISNHQLQDIETLKTFTGTHQEVYDTEQWVHEELTERGFHASWIPWTTECFTEDSEDMIYRLLDESDLVEGEW